LDLLGIEMRDQGPDTTARLTVTHPLIAGTGYLWAPVVTNESTERQMAAYRCTQLILYT
jgi:hypothetical protein